MFYDQELTDARRLWDHILCQAYGTTDLSSLKHLPPDPEGHAFFLAIDAAFSQSKQYVPVHYALVQYLAGWGRETTKGWAQQGGPFKDSDEHSHFVFRAFQGFIQTLREAIKRGRLRYEEKIMYGCFVVPEWLVEKYMDEVWREAESFNKHWDSDPEGARWWLEEHHRRAKRWSLD